MVYLKRKIIALLFRLVGDADFVVEGLTPEKKQGFWIAMYDNPVFRAYMNQRKEYLKAEITQAVLEGNPGNAWIFTGQMKEILEMARNARVALERKQKEDKLKASLAPVKS